MIMTNTLRQKLSQGAATLGTHFLSNDPDIPEIIGDAGLFDYGEYCAQYSPFDMAPLSHMARAGQLIDPADGAVMTVDVGDAKWEEITVRGETIRARRYVMTGDLDRELWYDAAGMLVKVRFAGEDGSDLQFRML